MLILALMFTSTLGTIPIVKPSLTENSSLGENFIGKDRETSLLNQTTGQDQWAGLKNVQHDVLPEESDANLSVLENPSQTSQNRKDKWNFSNTNEWSKFAYTDGNRTRLIIGVDNENLACLQNLEGIVAKHEAKIVGKVSFGGKLKALVVELLLASVTALVEDIRSVELASYIEPNMKVQALFAPSDPYWSMQWGPQKIGADWAWNTTVGDSSILVAVVDTGICYTHPDLTGNYVALGYDWVNNDNDPIDDNGHGTHCAGIIAATTNNSIGIAGLAQVRIMAEKVLDSGGGGYYDWVANGIINATDCGAGIISMSLGGYGDSELVHDAIRYAYEAGVLVIAAAGNDNTNTKLYPAGYDEVVAVAATDLYDNKASFSNWGDWIELAAPGVDIYSTVPWGYESWSGTSMATPHVSGVAALIWSRYPSKTRDWVRMWLRNTADDLGDPGFDMYYGYGRVNARKAVEQAPPAHELIAYEWTTPPYVEPGASGIIDATILNFGEDETDVMVHLLTNGTTADSAVIEFLAAGNSVTVGLSWHPVVEGLYNVTLYVEPVPGETSLGNNVLWTCVFVGFPVKAVVLHSAGNVDNRIVTNWQVLNNEWRLFGDIMVYIDYTSLNKEDITYSDIVGTEADVLIISCAYDSYAGWQFTDSEVEAIARYVHEGHGLIATAGTLYSGVPNNNKLAPLFGLSETTMWSATGTDLLHLMNSTHPIFTNVPNPLVFPQVGTAIPYDGQWDSNELVGGKYLALGHYQESAIVAYRGLVYISPWLEVIPSYYHHHLQLLYNAITWSRYQKPKHEITVSLQCPIHVKPGESVLVNATVQNMGLNNETNVELQLLLNSTQVANLTIPTLEVGQLEMLSYVWKPTEGIYNVTAYAPSVPGEEDILNNVKTVFSRVSYAAVIGFIETHGESLHGDDLKIFYQSLGHIVITIRSTLTPELLADYDILIVGEDWNNNPWSRSEIAAVQDFIRSGKGFVGVGDELAYSVQEILGAYGIAYTGYFGFPGSSSNFDHSHPIMEGVNYIYASFPVNSLSATSPGYWIANDAYNVYMLIAGAEAQGHVLCMSDDFAADLYYDDNEIMFANTANWMAVKYDHDLAVSLSVPTSLELGNTALLNATVQNRGLNNETSVELQLLINGAVADSVMIPELPTRTSYSLNYAWSPAIEGLYNVTAYAPPLTNEGLKANNIATKFVIVRISPRLLVVDTPGPEDTGALDKLGHEYTLVSSTGFATVNLSRFNVLFVGWTPGQAVVNALLARKSDIADWIASGNGIVALSEPSETNGWAWLPLWVAPNTYGGDVVHILEPTHPVNQNLTDADLSFWGMSYHGSFTSQHEDWQILALGGNWPYFQITLAATHGNGKIVITQQDPDWHFYYNNQPGAGKLLENMIKWVMPPEHEIAVYLDAPRFHEPNASVLLNATISNAGLRLETNVELELIINSTIVSSVLVPELSTGSSYLLSYPWTPSEGVYNVTAYAPPIFGEEIINNNNATQFVIVRPLETVLFDQTHGTDNISSYSTWTENLGQTGYIVNTHTSEPITPEVLAGYDVFVIIGPRELYGSAELLAIRNFVLNGGGLLVIGDNKPSICTDLTTFAGITWTAGGTTCFTTNIKPHEITSGVSRVYLVNPSTRMVVTGTAQDIIRDNADNIMLAASLGHVIGFADKDSLRDTSIAIADNLRLANNIVVWLAAEKPLPTLPDVAIVSVTTSTTKIYAGSIANISVVVSNQGETTENFNVAVYVNTAFIESQNITLSSGYCTTMTFVWNTTGFAPGNYTISAYAWPVVGETDTADNRKEDGVVTVAIPGDFNGDSIVDGSDFFILLKSWGTTPPSDPRADFNGDGVVDGSDFHVLLQNWGTNADP